MLPSLLPEKSFPMDTSQPRVLHTSHRDPVPAGSSETLCDNPLCACLCSPPAHLQPYRGAPRVLSPWHLLGSCQACLCSHGPLWVPSTSQRMNRSQQEEASSHFLPRPCSAQAVPVVAGASDLPSPPALVPVTNPQRTPGCSRMQPWGDVELCWKHVYLHPLPCQPAGYRTRLDFACGFAGRREVGGGGFGGSISPG